MIPATKGAALPSSRTLAERLGLNRSTVYRAYEELWALGYVDSRPGSYTRVRRRFRDGEREASSAGSRPAGTVNPRAVAALERAGFRIQTDSDEANPVYRVRLDAGGEAMVSKTGHAFLKARMRETGAVYGGEMSAHHYFRNFMYCDSGMIPWLLVAEHALAAARCDGVSALHDVTEGGVGEALHEMAQASGLTIEADRGRIPVLGPTRALCADLGLDPLGLIGSGSLLLTCRPDISEALATAICADGVPVSRIGKVLDPGEGIEARRCGRRVEWPAFAVDELTRLF